MSIFAVADIHGNYRALVECLSLCKFDKEKDKLICLGDVCDRYPETDACIDELLSIKDLVYILGNHDEYFINWMKTGIIDYNWIVNGGSKTLICYNNKPEDVPETHKKLLENAVLYYEQDNKVFVHGGLDPNQHDMTKQDKQTLIWDRDLIRNAKFKMNQKPDFKYGKWESIWIGHTPTINWKIPEPTKFCNVIDIDTGAGYSSGKLTIVNIITGQCFSSKPAAELYNSSNGG